MTTNNAQKQLAFFEITVAFNGETRPLESMKIALEATGRVQNENYTLSRAATRELDSLLDQAKEIILRDIALQDSKTKETMQKSKECLLACFPTYFHFGQVDNEYRLKGSYLAACNPWLRVLCPIGYVTIGWRTSVIHIDFKETVFTQFEIANIFSKYYASCASISPVVHAANYEEAREYLQQLFDNIQRKIINHGQEETKSAT